MGDNIKKAPILGVALVAVIILCIGLAVFSVTSTNDARAATGTKSTSSASSDTSGYGLVNDGTLTVSADLDNPPFIYKSGEETAGFTFDLLAKIAERLGVGVTYVEPLRDDAVTDPLTQAEADLVATPLVIGPGYAGSGSFTDSYLDLDLCVATMKSSGLSSVSDLAGKRVAVVKGSVAETWAVNNIPNARIVEYDDIIYVLSALRSGNVDAIVGDYAITNYNCRIKYGNERIIQVMDGSQAYGFLVRHGNTALLNAINKAIADLKSSGEYDELYDSWFGGDNEIIYDVPSRDIDGMGDAVHLSPGQ